MYDGVQYRGETLKTWTARLGNQFSPGELYRMIQTGVDISALVS